jgi:pyrimidine-nucleoside phosphorylase
MAQPRFPQDVIARKRDGATLTADEIEFFVRGVVDGTVADYQAAALLMAIVLRGLSPAETAALTHAMQHSGEVIDLSDLPGPKVDKHSTGGVGDKVSLLLAPWVAACGVIVPMMSGRGLGHTGGTLDKLEAIPGFRTDLTVPEFRTQLARVGVAMIGQTAQLVPADRKLYALRDVTATVESIPLICASIMSKKLAEGIDALVLDVKFGRGAFMKTRSAARELATAMVACGQAAGRPTRALLTPMDEPLGHAVGNAVEVREAIEGLRGRGPADLMAVTQALASEMLLLAGVAHDAADAQSRLDTALADGTALQRFRQIVAAQGGDPRVVDSHHTVLPAAPTTLEVPAPPDAHGYVAAVDALAVAQVAMALGAGRASISAPIDHAAGLTGLVKVGQPIAPGQPLARLHGSDADLLAAVALRLTAAVRYADTAPRPVPHVAERL